MGAEVNTHAATELVLQGEQTNKQDECYEENNTGYEDRERPMGDEPALEE